MSIVWYASLRGWSRFLGASFIHSWAVPGVMFVVVVVVAWLGWRWIRSEHLETLAAVPLFAGLSRHELLTILGSARATEFPPGSSIVTEGEKGKGFYVITRGRTRVTVAGSQVAELGEGSYFGEMAVIDGGPRTATITAETAVSTLELTPVALQRVLQKEPAVSQAVFEELRRRLEGAGGSVPASDEPVSVAKLIDMSERLRAIEHPDWVRPASPKHRWLGLSSLFARGR